MPQRLFVLAFMTAPQWNLFAGHSPVFVIQSIPFPASLDIRRVGRKLPLNMTKGINSPISFSRSPSRPRFTFAVLDESSRFDYEGH